MHHIILLYECDWLYTIINSIPNIDDNINIYINESFCKDKLLNIRNNFEKYKNVKYFNKKIPYDEDKVYDNLDVMLRYYNDIIIYIERLDGTLLTKPYHKILNNIIDIDKHSNGDICYSTITELLEYIPYEQSKRDVIRYIIAYLYGGLIMDNKQAKFNNKLYNMYTGDDEIILSYEYEFVHMMSIFRKYKTPKSLNLICNDFFYTRNKYHSFWKDCLINSINRILFLKNTKQSWVDSDIQWATGSDITTCVWNMKYKNKIKVLKNEEIDSCFTKYPRGLTKIYHRKLEKVFPNKFTLLITTCVNPKSHCTKESNEYRLQFYRMTIRKWLDNTNLPIIIVENSGYSFPEFQNTRAIIISFNEDEIGMQPFPTSTSYEAISILTASARDVFVKTEYIIKITGRYYLPDLEKTLIGLQDMNESIIYQSIRDSVARRQNCEIFGFKKEYCERIYAPVLYNKSEIEMHLFDIHESLNTSHYRFGPLYLDQEVTRGGDEKVMKVL